MSYRVLISGAVLAVLILSASPAVLPAAGQALSNTVPPEDAALAEWPPPPSTYTLPRTPWGDPDIQGIWDNQTFIPMDRPDKYAGTPVLSDQGWAGWLDDNPVSNQAIASGQQYNNFWNNRNFVRDRRTSLVVDPPDGRIPPMTQEAISRFEAHEAAMNAPGRNRWESWLDFRTMARCIAAHSPQGPMDYNSATLIMQSPGWVVLVRERLDTRVIPLDGRPHLDSDIRQWNGDSRGYFEGNTLVVETTNFTDKQMGTGRLGPKTQVGASAGPAFIPRGITFGTFKLTERWVPIGPNRIHYYATLEDPQTWERPWTFMLPWVKEDDYLLLEFACIEGDISVGAALVGARRIEAQEEALGVGPGGGQ